MYVADAKTKLGKATVLSLRRTAELRQMPKLLDFGDEGRVITARPVRHPETPTECYLPLIEETRKCTFPGMTMLGENTENVSWSV